MFEEEEEEEEEGEGTNAHGSHEFTYFNDRGRGGKTEIHILYPKKIPCNFIIFVYQKKSLLFSIPQKIPQCFCISKLFYNIPHIKQ